jgi:hypothetical protein
MELREEPEDTAPTPPGPDMPQEELEPKEEVVYLSDDEDAEFAQGGVQPPSPPQDGSAEVGVPSFSMGWTTRIHHKSSYDTPSHHRLVSMLSAYFMDWDPAFEYVCWEHKHPLESYLLEVQCAYLHQGRGDGYLSAGPVFFP